MQEAAEKAELRILRLLARGNAMLDGDAGAGSVRLVCEAVGTVAVERVALERLRGQGLVAAQGSDVRLTPAGRARLMRLRAGRDETVARRSGSAEATVKGAPPVRINDAESPLAQLARRRTRGGSPYLDQREFDAGERLRRDLTCAMLMPRISANWDAAVATGRRSGAGTAADLTDAALAARQRVDAAIAAVGPELAGVLIDICCFLKGLEMVEIERQWPARSAKIVLKTALAALARHYQPPPKGGRGIVHWGTVDYRPRLGGQAAG